MRKILAVLAAIALAGSAAGYTTSELESFRESYNNQTDEVPAVLGDIVGGETVNVHIENGTSESTLGAEMDGLEISELRDGGYENETLNVYANSSTVETVVESGRPFEQVKKELDQNDITYESTTLRGQVKLTVFDTLRGLASSFGLGF
jgi:hypothetical protein